MTVLISTFFHLLILLPGVLIIFLLLKYDKFPEPPRWLIVTVLLAFAGTTIFGTVKYEILRMDDWAPSCKDQAFDSFLSYFYCFLDAYIFIAFGEELVKFLVIFLFCIKLSEFNEKIDGLIYGAMAGLGFALLEGFSYLAAAIAEAGSSPELVYSDLFLTILGRWTAIPAHVFFGLIMGSFFTYAIFYKVNKYIYLALAILVPTILHGTYDYILMTPFNVITGGLIFTFLYAGMLAWSVALFIHYRGLQRLKAAEPERKYNLF